MLGVSYGQAPLQRLRSHGGQEARLDDTFEEGEGRCQAHVSCAVVRDSRCGTPREQPTTQESSPTVSLSTTLRRSAAEDDRGWSPRVVGVFGPLEFLLICLAGWRPSATNARPPSADIRPRNGTPPPPPRSPFRSSRRAARAANRWPDGQAARQRRGSGQSRVGRSRGGW